MASQACCDAGAPVGWSHTDAGKVDKLGNGVPCYFTGDAKQAKAPVLIVTDIFGIGHPQVRDVADRIAAAGFYVAVPDWFDGQPMDMANFPPKDKDAFPNFLARIEPGCPAIVSAAKEHFKSVGLEGKKIGVCGFCWGGSWSLRLAADPDFGAAMTAHPARINVDMAKAAQCPVALFPAAGDIDCQPLFDEVKSHPNGGASMHKRYDDQVHGFVAARGAWDKPEVKAAADEVVENTIQLFKTAL